TVSVRPVNLRLPAGGLLGGEPGASGRLLLNGQPSPTMIVTLKPGDELLAELAGGGGFGPAAQRNPVLRERDLALGYITAG
ncbi:MAG: hydantoinase B/oxoprolinase family protein, partial [Planctomycetota bacterium]